MDKSRPKPKPMTYARPSANKIAAMEQDEAAGGSDYRKMRTKSGDVVTVSLSASTSGHSWRVSLRFKSGGQTVQRAVGMVEASSRLDALRLGWKMIRAQKTVEKDGWAWIAAAAD